MSISSNPVGAAPEIQKYELFEEIGHGGMATVYRGRDRRLERDVAIKVIHKHLRENPEVRRRFVAEARAVAKLRHPGIVEVYDVSDEEDPERYLVVELIRGTSLREVLKQHPELPAEVGACVSALLCDAVEHAHQSGVIHRDIKPENVLLELPAQLPGAPAQRRNGSEPPLVNGSDGQPDSGRRDSGRRSGDGELPRVKLTDFGIAKVLDAQAVTSTGQILGSPAHMAPEQIEGGNVTPATDVFALGVLFYECLVGHLPFEGKNPAQVLRRVIEGRFEPADAERPPVGGRWARIVARALERDPMRRPRTASDLGDLIRAELAALGIQDLRREIGAYFADTSGYRARTVASLVPRLLSRGETARRKGLVHGAAADFNRALALRPDDLAIMRRVSSLSAETAWRRRAARAGAIAVLAGLVGATAFGVARVLKPSATSRLAPATTTAVTSSPGSATSATTAASRVAPTPAPPSAVTASTVVPRASSSSEAPGRPSASTSVVAVAISGTDPGTQPRAPETRRVTFTVSPPGANFELDGRPESWAGREFTMRVGSTHQVRITMPPGAKCCDPLDSGFTVTPPPADTPDAVQAQGFRLKTRPATVQLGGGPAGAMATCPFGAVGSVPITVGLPTATWTGHCEFTPGGGVHTVVVRAGETNTIVWP